MTKAAAEGEFSDYELHTTPVAIIGMASIFPQATNLTEYWNNILKKVDCIIDVPLSRWDPADYYDPNPTAPDKTYCKRGGFIPDVDFDPTEFGLPPNILEVTDVSQLLGLVVAKEAMEDAGYGENRVFKRETTGVMLGVVGMSTKLFTPLMARLQYPVWEKVLKASGISDEDTHKIIEKIKLAYVGWEENSFPGTIANVIAGRIANRLDLGGTNLVTDAACGSSLAAVKLAVGELIEGKADMMITGGVDLDNSINTYMCFSKTPAFSKGERVRSFDASSDGMMIGEGVGMVVLKRLADARRDHDRIYAVIKGVGSSSDGRFKSIYAPRPAGQALAVRRAYHEAGFAPATVSLIEAHGTGTTAGDPAEFEGLKDVFCENSPDKQTIALGSVKSQIGHTKAAAGIASLIKTSLALYHKVLPATINVTTPNPKLGIDATPFYINTETRPWIGKPDGTPRRAGVSSFGFGGTNFHVSLEEYESEPGGGYRVNEVPQIILLSAPNPDELLKLCRETESRLQVESGTQTYLELVNHAKDATIPADHARLGFLADSIDGCLVTLKASIETLVEKRDLESWENPKGIFYRKSGYEASGKVVALFPGQGSQYVDMGRELATNFPPIRNVFGSIDKLFAADGKSTLSSIIYPPPPFDQPARDRQTSELQKTEYAQPAIGSFSVGLFKLLQEAGIQADFTAGHSFGELTALWASGVLSDESYLSLAKARGKAMAPPEDPSFDAGSMLAVKGDVERIREYLKAFPEITLANWNSNNQVALAGPRQALKDVQQALTEKGFSVVPLPVSAAFHTPLVGHAQKPFAEAVKKTPFKSPETKVFSNTTGNQYPTEPDAIRQILAGHILKPVLFKDEIEAIYKAGGFFFIEFGPKNVLTNLVNNILADKPHVAIALNANAKKDSDRQLREAVVQLRVAGLNLNGFDPYRRQSKDLPRRKKSSVTVTLNGGLYMTEKTREAFRKALQESQPVKLNHNNSGSPLQTPKQEMTMISLPEPEKVKPNNGNHSALGTVSLTPAPFSSYEKNLSEFEAHQRETVKLQEQFLQNDAEYGKIFADLTRMELSLLSSNDHTQLEKIMPMLESLERSMMRFHDHQAETLRVQDDYLKRQSEFSRNFIDLLKQQPAMLGGSEEKVQLIASTETKRPVIERIEPIQTLPVTNFRPVVETPPPAPKETRTPPVLDTPSSNISQALLKVVSEKTGYPVEMLEPSMDMEADLGIDSIKRVEILGAMQTLYPELPKIEPEALAELRTLGQIIEHLGGKASLPGREADPIEKSAAPDSTGIENHHNQAGSSADADTITRAFLQTVSEKTGYPVEMLELGMDMEADLGIDSIKRVEILGAIQVQFPNLPKIEPETLAELRTLGQVTGHLAGGLGQTHPF